MKRYGNPAHIIPVTVGDTFALELAGNPSTGYTWQVDVDAGYVELVSQEFEPAGAGVGSGGCEVVRVRALATGNTEIDCAYRRPWDPEPRETKRFQIAII